MLANCQTKISWRLDQSGLQAELVKNPHSLNDWILYIDGFMHSSINKDNRAILNFMCMERIGLLVKKILDKNPSGSVITFGAGALSLPGYISSLFPDASQTVIELETNLVNKIQEFLPIKDGKPIEFFYGDAKDVLSENIERMQKRFDIAIIDIFLGKLSPDYLDTLEFCNMVNETLSDSGVVMINFKDSGTLKETEQQYRALQKVFNFVKVIKDNYFKQKDTGTDILFLASKSNIISELIQDGTGYESDEILHF